MLAAGIDPVHVARLGGWESLEMMTEYAEATRTEAALAAARKLGFVGKGRKGRKGRRF